MNDFTLDPATTALVVIDLQHGIVARQCGPHASADVVARLRDEIEKISKSPAFRDGLAAIGVQSNTDGVALAEFQKREVERWQKAVRDSGAKAD